MRTACFILAAVVLNSCCPSLETRIVPRDTIVPAREIVDSGSATTFTGALGTPCDTGAILEAKCKGIIEGLTAEGDRWRILFRTARVQASTLRDSLGNAIAEYGSYRTAAELQLSEAQRKISGLDTTSVVTPRSSFLRDLGIGAIGFVFGLVTLIGAFYFRK